MSGNDLIIKTGLDATGVRQGANEVEQAVGKMATKVESDSKRVGKALEGAGEGGEQAAAKIDRDTNRMAASIQRATAAAESGGRSTAAYFESIAKQRGIPADTLRPYLDQLRQAEAVQRAVGLSLDGMGVSAKQTAAAMRGVPAQFTDIVTSIQGGQAPLTVFLQQGGQLKDMFGGAGNAARALGSYVAGLITPFTLVAAGVAAGAAAFVLGRQESSEYTKALLISGNAVDATTARLAGMAAAINQAGGASQGRAAELLASMAGMAGLTADNLQRMAAAALAFERAGGPAAEKTAEAFADLAKRPLEAALKLNEAQNFLTRSTYEQIKALSDQGRTTDAARAAQDAYASALEERAPKMLATLGFVERAWMGIKGAVVGAVDAVKGIGRNADPLGDEIARLQDLVQKTQASRGIIGAPTAEREVAALQAKINLLQQAAGYEALSAAYQAQNARQVDALARLQKSGLEEAGKQARFDKESLEARNLMLAAGRDEAAITAVIANLRKKIFASDDNKAKQDLEAQTRTLLELSGVTGSYVQEVEKLAALERRGLIDKDRLLQLNRELVARQPFAKAAAKELADAAELEAKAISDAEKARTSHLRALEGTIARGGDVLTNLREEIVGMTQGKAVLADRVALRLQEQASALELQAIRLDDRDLDSQEALALRERAAQLREEARLRKELASAVSAKEVSDANARTAKEAAREWERVTDQIGQSLADAIMKGGKSASEYLKDLFRTLVLRPILQSTVQSGTKAVNGLLGGSGLSGWDFVASAAGYAGTVSGNTYGTNFGSQQSRMLAAQEAGMATSGAGIAAAVSAVAPYIGLIIAGVGKAQGDYQKGFTADVAQRAQSDIFGGNFGKFSTEGALNNLLRKVGFNDEWASILSGSTAVARLIGRRAPEATAQGLSGTFGGGDFQGQLFTDWVAKGGFFRSDKSGTNFSALNEGQAADFSAAGKEAFSTISEWAKVLGLPLQQLHGVTSQVRIQLTGVAADDEKAVAGAIKSYADALGASFTSTLQPFKKAGEEVTETLQRLAGLQNFSKELNGLGGIFSRVAGLSFDARESLFGLAGGIEAFRNQALGFVQNYFTPDEIAGVKARDVQGVLGSVGITQDVNTREQFRALLEGTNISTDQGRQQLATLLGLQGDFAQVADYLAATSRTLTDAAALAPQSAILQSLLDGTGQSAQLDAINSVGTGVGLVVDAVRELIDVVRSGGGVFTPRWEVVQP
jgi:phage-related minor tail protein